jgi:hypothetical protein
MEEMIPHPSSEVADSVTTPEEIPQPTATKPKSTYTFLGIGILVAVIAIIAFWDQSLPTQQKKSVVVASPSPTPLVTHVPYPSPANEEVQKQWMLKKKTANGSEVVITFPPYMSHIAQYKDLLLYELQNTEVNPSTAQLMSYNLKTGQTKAIYDESKSKDFINGRGLLSVSDIRAIDNTVFFSIGGYMSDGALFWFDPPSYTVHKLGSVHNGHIEFWKNRYWVLGGEGDGCAGYVSYATLDPVTKKMTPVTEVADSCEGGEKLLGLDKRDRLIIAYADNVGNVDPPDEYGTTVFRYVTAVSVNNPSIKEGVIAKQDMPANIESIMYVENSDQLFLQGKEKYLFDLGSNSFTKTEMATPSAAPQFGYSNVGFDEQVKKMQLPPEYQLVFE